MEARGTGRNVPRSELVCPKDFMQSWDLEAHLAAKLERPPNETDVLNNIATKMGISDETVKELSEVCGKGTLYHGSEPKTKLSLLQMTEVPPGVKLECVKYQMDNKKRRQEDESLKMTVNRRMKYNSLDDYLAVIVPNSDPLELDLMYKVEQPNVVLSVEVTKCLMQGETSQPAREKETFLVLGSQYLTELRDKIKCSSDAVIPGDYSCMPDLNAENLPTAGEIFKSSFFFIENTFYNDMRLPDNKDYSKPILKWAKNAMPESELKTAEMSQTTFFDLTIRLGHHYLFMHQGNCEHSVLFTDMRLFSSTDAQDRRLYPIPYITRTKNRAVCQGCLKLSARWIVRQSPLIPTDPCFLCRVCFKTLMYTRQGQKAAAFKAQPFLDFQGY